MKSCAIALLLLWFGVFATGQIVVPVETFPIPPGTKTVTTPDLTRSAQANPTKPLWTPGTSCWHVRERCDTVAWYYDWSRFCTGPGERLKIVGPRGSFVIDANDMFGYELYDRDRDGDIDLLDWSLRMNDQEAYEKE